VNGFLPYRQDQRWIHLATSSALSQICGVPFVSSCVEGDRSESDRIASLVFSIVAMSFLNRSDEATGRAAVSRHDERRRRAALRVTPYTLAIQVVLLTIRAIQERTDTRDVYGLTTLDPAPKPIAVLAAGSIAIKRALAVSSVVVTGVLPKSAPYPWPCWRSRAYWYKAWSPHPPCCCCRWWLL